MQAAPKINVHCECGIRTIRLRFMHNLAVALQAPTVHQISYAPKRRRGAGLGACASLCRRGLACRRGWITSFAAPRCGLGSRALLAGLGDPTRPFKSRCGERCLSCASVLGDRAAAGLRWPGGTSLSSSLRSLCFRSSESITWISCWIRGR